MVNENLLIARNSLIALCSIVFFGGCGKKDDMSEKICLLNFELANKPTLEENSYGENYNSSTETANFKAPFNNPCVNVVGKNVGAMTIKLEANILSEIGSGQSLLLVALGRDRRLIFSSGTSRNEHVIINNKILYKDDFAPNTEYSDNRKSVIRDSMILPWRDIPTSATVEISIPSGFGTEVSALMSLTIEATE